MTDDPGIQARHAAGLLLNAALERRNGLDEALSKPPVSGLEPQDRAFARACAMGALRRLGEIDRALDGRLKTAPPQPVRTLLRIALAQRLVLSYGFMEQPNVPKALGLCRKQGLKFDIMATSFFLGRRSVVPSSTQGMPMWQDRLYIFLMRNAANPTDFFHIPPGRVVELGAQVSV